MRKILLIVSAALLLTLGVQTSSLAKGPGDRDPSVIPTEDTSFAVPNVRAPLSPALDVGVLEQPPALAVGVAPYGGFHFDPIA
jgi:hypothetical protein